MSKRMLRTVIYKANCLIKNGVRLSYQTRADYRKNMKLILKQLYDGGFQFQKISSLKRKHIDYLITQWGSQKLNIRTIKNRLSVIRYVCKRIDKENILPQTNRQLNIPNSGCHLRKNRALNNFDADKIKDIYTRYSTRLQRAFGLRREESMKIIPSQADEGYCIRLKASWTKGGIERTVPITTKYQRELLDEVKKFVGRGKSLIQQDKSYRRQLDTYTAQVQQAGFKNLHGLRYVYAQRRYYILTNQLSGGRGWECPFAGGKSSKELLDWQKKIDYKVREKISFELGHSRTAIARVYLG